MSVVLLLLVIIVILGVAGIVTTIATDRRQHAAQAFATAHGLTWLGRAWPLGECEFTLYQKNAPRTWDNAMAGSWRGVPVSSCDYTYVIKTNKSTQSYRFSTVVVQTGLLVPAVTIAPRGMLSELAEHTVGGTGIHFESTAFNDRFHVQCSDEQFAVELIDARMIETLLAAEQSDGGIHLQFGPTHALIWTKRRPFEQTPALFDAGVALLQHVPQLVRSRYAPPAPPPSL